MPEMAVMRFLTFCVILDMAAAAIIPVLTPPGLEPGIGPIITPLEPVHDDGVVLRFTPHDRRQSSVAGRLTVGAVQGLASAGSSMIGQEVVDEMEHKEAEKEKKKQQEHDDEKKEHDEDKKDDDEDKDHDKEEKKHDE